MSITPGDTIILALTDFKEHIDAIHTAWTIYINAENEHGKKLIENEITASFEVIEEQLEALINKFAWRKDGQQ